MKQDYKWEIKLYPDSTSYDCNLILIQAQDYFDQWAYILHDRDKKEDGMPDKPHIHFYGSISSGSRTLECIAHMCGIPDNCLTAIRYVKSWKGAIRYLTHIDFPNKARYSLEECTSNFDLSPFFGTKADKDKDDSEKAQKIFDYLDEFRNKFGRNPTIEHLSRWTVKNNLWSAYRRGFAVWSQIIKDYKGDQL